ncbi:hypothetical protein [Nonomuraea sp. NPDC048826]|uniref:hypothetical protein n=1 Tax=Nonomuraea sp. NPDC048826 TaxID=3364347 RepID=UPI0037159C3E
MRLAYGVMTGRDQQVRDVRGGPADGLAPGSAVVVGPAGGDPRPAAAELARLVAAGGVAVAGAGVDLGRGFVSARLDGVRGDRRDAVLAALRILGPDGVTRVGGRAGVLVALFGPDATKPVGAAAVRAIAEERWAAVDLASAASALLTPEQVESVLNLDGVDTAGDVPPSVVAGHLDRVLGPYSRKRRLDLLLDLWRRVAGHQERARRAERLRGSQARVVKVEELTERHRRHDDDFLISLVTQDLGHEPTLAEAARWVPDTGQRSRIMLRAVADALAATVLARTAIAVSDHGVRDGLARAAGELAAAAQLMDAHEAGEAARRVPGLVGLPARPGCYVRDLTRRRDFPEDYVRQRVSRARDYGVMLLDRLHDLLEDPVPEADDGFVTGFRRWRAAVGYSEAHPPASWTQPPLGEERPPLADRLAADPGRPPEEVEEVADLLWLADLADAVARLNGYGSAEVHAAPPLPYAIVEPPEPDTVVPRLDSAPVALAGAAQLVSLGGRPPRQGRTWDELAAGLVRSMEAAQATVERFPLPEPVAAADGGFVPGTRLRVECARNPRMLAQWASYMGNCIGGDRYLQDAMLGRCVLAALRDEDGRIQANLELRRRHQGWQVVDLLARFNEVVDEEVRERVLRWAATLPPETPPPDSVAELVPADRPVQRRRRSRLAPDVSGPLSELAATALAAPEVRRALRDLAILAAPDVRPALHDLAALDPGEGAGVLTALRRMSAERMAAACLAALPLTGPAVLWRATGVRPLAAALAGLDPQLTARYDRLGLLLADQPLPGSLRAPARHEAVAAARSMELVARRVRAAVGRLARTGDPVLARQIARRSDTSVLCALVVAATSWGVPGVAITRPGDPAVPGYPASALDDPSGPWQRALSGAGELGADLGAYPELVARDGLRIPAAWLDQGGWPVLWQRAARSR